MARREVRLQQTEHGNFKVMDVKTGFQVGVIRHYPDRGGWQGYWLLPGRGSMRKFHQTPEQAGGSFGKVVRPISMHDRTN